MVRRSLHTCWSVCMGQWKDGWNITPLRLRLRTRDYAKEVWRKNYDQEDYRIMEYATARNIGAASLALPGGAVFWALALYLNKPPFRHYDDKLDIIQHKVEEPQAGNDNHHAQACQQTRASLAEEMDDALQSLHLPLELESAFLLVGHGGWRQWGQCLLALATIGAYCNNEHFFEINSGVACHTGIDAAADYHHLCAARNG